MRNFLHALIAMILKFFDDIVKRKQKYKNKHTLQWFYNVLKLFFNYYVPTQRYKF